VIVYLHGFNSSPLSHKAQVLERHLASRGLAHEFACPELPPSASEAVAAVERTVGHARLATACYIGSSLGGYYATHFVERHGGRAVLLNPAIDPHVGLRASLGMQKNLYTGKAYELTAAHLDQWQRLYAPEISAERYLLVVETGDEVLDYRRALERYAGAEQIVVRGGDHSLQSFPQHLDRIVRFAGY